LFVCWCGSSVVTAGTGVVSCPVQLQRHNPTSSASHSLIHGTLPHTHLRCPPCLHHPVAPGPQ
jgi:hypothetical protein